MVFLCNYCHKAYDKNARLRYHVSHEHPGAELPPRLPPSGGKRVQLPPDHSKSTCQHCGKIFALRKSLLRHIKKQHSRLTDQSVNRSNCQYCDKTFSRRLILKRHIIRVHPGQSIPIDLRSVRFNKPIGSLKFLQFPTLAGLVWSTFLLNRL